MFSWTILFQISFHLRVCVCARVTMKVLFFSSLCLLSLYKSFCCKSVSVRVSLCCWARERVHWCSTNTQSFRKTDARSSCWTWRRAGGHQWRTRNNGLNEVTVTCFLARFPSLQCARQHLSMLATWRTPTVWRHSQHRFTKQTSCCLVVFCFWVKKLLEASALPLVPFPMHVSHKDGRSSAGITSFSTRLSLAVLWCYGATSSGVDIFSVAGIANSVDISGFVDIATSVGIASFVLTATCWLHRFRWHGKI